MSRPAFIRVPRIGDDLPALIRADMITAVLPQRVKRKGSDEVREELMIQIGTAYAIQTTLSEADLRKMVLSATGQPITVVEEP